MKSTYRKFRFTSNAGATHTPTPWRANESVFSANGMTELHIGTPEMTACVVYVDKAAPYAATQEANAAYIVKACNSHAQLVAALRTAATALGCIALSGDRGATAAVNALEAVNATLARLDSKA